MLQRINEMHCDSHQMHFTWPTDTETWYFLKLEKLSDDKLRRLSSDNFHGVIYKAIWSFSRKQRIETHVA